MDYDDEVPYTWKMILGLLVFILGGGIVCLVLIWSPGCAARTSSLDAGRDATDETSLVRQVSADIAGVRSEVAAVRSSVGDIGELKADVSAVRTSIGSIGDVRTELSAIKTVVGDIKAGGDVNDTWTMRLLAISLAATYPIGKLIWIIGQKAKAAPPWRGRRSVKPEPRERSPPAC